MDRLLAMRALVRVIETGSFSAAAKQMRLGQPAVSRSVAQLEKRLGVPLILRSSRKLIPTEAGRNFFEHAKRSLEEADEAELAARGAGAGLSGVLRFAAAVTFARLHVIPQLPSFLEQHPTLQVEAILDDRNVDLIGEGIDVALRLGKLADSTHVAHRIGSAKRVVLGSKKYFARAGKPRKPSDLPAHQSVIYTLAGGGENWTFTKGNKQESVTLQGKLRTTAAEAMREAVFCGMGLCVASDGMFPPAEDDRVVRVLTDWQLPPLDIWAVYPAGRRASAKARAFAAHIEQALSKTGFSASATGKP